MWPKLRGLERLFAIQTRTFGTLSFIAFEVGEWAADREKVLARLRGANLGSTLVVRSCVGMEDAVDREPPGFFDSVLNVPASEIAVQEAVDKVIASYARRVVPCPVPDQIIVQRQLLDSKMCGVFRVGMDAREYIEVDYDETPGLTDTVTSGTASKRATISMRAHALPPPWRQIRECADELHEFFAPPFLVEFAVDSAGVPVVFQIRSDRRLANQPVQPSAGIAQNLAEASRIIKSCGPLSVMTDWNPAEILGVRPQPLDASLYDKLVLQGAWSEGRASVGWARPADAKLMVVVGGRPYVKIRQSLQSLLPAILGADVARRLLQNRLARLEAARDLHDKVEFQVMWSAYAFNAGAEREELVAGGIANAEVDELFDALKRVTRYAIEAAPDLLAADRAGVARLEAARATFKTMMPDAGPSEMAKRIRDALRICIDYGTIAFSRQARLAFTFRFIINHLVAHGDVDGREVELWQSGLNTIARQFNRDLRRMCKGEMPQAVFLKRYGHLRPSTYDLESLRYDERGVFTGDEIDDGDPHGSTPRASARLAEILAEVGTRRSEAEFWEAAAGAYRGREEMKFHFTGLLSDILRELALRTESVSLQKEALRRVPISVALEMMKTAPSWQHFAETVLRFECGEQWASGGLKLPDVIWGAGDLDLMMEPPLRPTFVGSLVASGRPHLVEKGSIFERGGLAGAVVAAESADPGYDWLFGHRFAGLVTAYGGEFSHMGLRCGEFGIPAVLGCGPAVFRVAVAARELRLDPVRGELWADGRRIVPA